MKKVLRDYQREAVDAFLGQPGGHGTLSMFTGSGKTLVAVETVRELRAAKPDLKTVVITYTIDLVSQWEKVFREQGFAEADIPPVITYALAIRRLADLAKYEFLIFDEMHHLGVGPAYQQLLEPAFNAMYALGLSATPPTDSENIALRVMPVVYTRNYQDGLTEGFAAPVKIIPVEVQLTPDERERYADLTDKIRSMMSRWGSDYQNKPYGKDALTGETIWGGTITNERRQLVALARNKYSAMEQIVHTVLELDRRDVGSSNSVPKRLFIWSSFIEALEKAKEVLNRNGLIAELVTGKTPKKERRRIIEQAWGKEFPILLVANVGSEGLDAPDAAVGVVLMGSKTQRETIQRLGRLLRKPTKDKVAKIYIVFASDTIDERLVPLFEASIK